MRVCSVLLAMWLGCFQVAAFANGDHQDKNYHENDEKPIMSDQKAEGHHEHDEKPITSEQKVESQHEHDEKSITSDQKMEGHHEHDEKPFMSDQAVEDHLRKNIQKEITIPTEYPGGLQLVGADPKGRTVEYTYVNKTVEASGAKDYFNRIEKNALPVLETMFCTTEQFAWYKGQKVEMSWRYQASDRSDVALVTCQQKETCQCNIKNLIE